MIRLSELRKEKGLSQKDFGKIIGAAQNTVSQWENGSREPDNETINRIANFFNVSIDYLLGNESTPTTTIDKGIKIPVLGEVAAGFPMFADENIIDYEEIPSEMAKNDDYFALKIHGDSMEPRICNNDVVIVRKQSDVESGDIAIVLINGDSGTCKKILKYENGITLLSFNIAYEPRFFTNEEINTLPVTIIGKVVELRGKLW